jgi:hypothetical protein
MGLNPRFQGIIRQYRPIENTENTVRIRALEEGQNVQPPQVQPMPALPPQNMNFNSRLVSNQTILPTGPAREQRMPTKEEMESLSKWHPRFMPEWQKDYIFRGRRLRALKYF